MLMRPGAGAPSPSGRDGIAAARGSFDPGSRGGSGGDTGTPADAGTDRLEALGMTMTVPAGMAVGSVMPLRRIKVGRGTW